MTTSPEGSKEFDFATHCRAAAESYQKARPLHQDFSGVVRSILLEALNSASIRVASIEVRAKEVASFEQKASTPAESDSSQPKYANPLEQITDLTGARIITFFPHTVSEVDGVLKTQFEILEKIDKTDLLLKTERLGYQSVHYLARLKTNRLQLPEYSRYRNLTTEIQVRTILQHAWAEIEHDIQYKSLETIPTPIRRRFIALAGLLEIADREFQAIQNEDERIRQEARVSVEEGHLERVEITGDALKAYLDKKIGSDGRMTKDSYEWTARILRGVGFSNFQQIDECIAPYDHDNLSRTLMGNRQGQLTRFEYMLLAGMGEEFIKQHTFRNLEWWVQWKTRHLKLMEDNKIHIGSYVPRVMQNGGTETPRP